MYLKSLEVQGFKAFANKIVFEFHNGITGIVGPNGSGKSNVADAVRWVLGEQSAKQLRGSSMQDVIFAGTENRKPLSYAYVAITLDNSDHQLPIEYEEVTVARRVYRSGESEYLLNGTVCRLKEVTELFYDTGIGKEGYSIIGQGQIDRILSGKPEERRELFDEAAGIVKYKKRKAATQKKLDREQESLVRVSDILSELERQVGPLSRQSEKARQYLRLRDELKDYEINLYLIDSARMEAQLSEIAESYNAAKSQLDETNEEYEKVRADFDRLEGEIEQLDARIESVRGQINGQTLLKEKLKSQIDILTEQIHTAETTDEHYKSRLEAIAAEKEDREKELEEYNKKKADLQSQAASVKETLEDKERELEYARAVADGISEQLRQGQEELGSLVKRRMELEAAQQRCSTMTEQVNIRKGQLNRRLLESQSKGGSIADELSEYKRAYEEVSTRIDEVRKEESDLDTRTKEWKIKQHENTRCIEEARGRQMKLASQLEALRNIAERYDGYGNSIRRVMERKRDFPGILGVVSDLISVEKQYETAIETALGGSIQNIVTEDEETARRMIEYLKENRYGRATFLPLTSVTARGTFKNDGALHEPGVRGLASDLVSCEPKYRQVVEYLLGRIVVADTIDHALALARKYRYSLHIVTIEGEHLSPGGSLSGGAFKNANHLLARNREIDEMEKKQRELSREIESLRIRGNDIQTAVDLNSEELEEVSAHLQDLYIKQNTARVNLESARQQQEESESLFAGLAAEESELEEELAQIDADQKKTSEELEGIATLEDAQQEANSRLEEIYSGKRTGLEQQEKEISQLQMELASIEQSCGFAQENCERIRGELDKYDTQVITLREGASLAREDIVKKQSDIEAIRKSIEQSDEEFERLENELKAAQADKEERSAAYKVCLARREEMTEHRSRLDKEIFRLESQREKVSETLQSQTNHLWEEYEITPHAAKEHRREDAKDASSLRKQVSECKDAIKALGSVNVNAVEEYKEVLERYEFQKTQYDDIVKAQETLMGIIAELDKGMTEQFTQKFAEIQREYDKSFQQLFGGGHGKLELVEGEDILECGIRIIAQPPGKKLQNMMQLSGGEKALSAIALLFAIQALKPSPFCLLDEIEAALDDANVVRYAEYLKKLTDHTQFIVITHRRGTMAAADRLYGITMQEKGVSTLVSVDLVEADLED